MRPWSKRSRQNDLTESFDKCSATECLQPSLVGEIENIIERIHAEQDCAILLVERNPEFVRAVTQKFAITVNGRIAVQGHINELSSQLATQ